MELDPVLEDHAGWWMTANLPLLAYAVASPGDYTLADLWAIARRPPATLRTEGGNIWRVWTAAGLVAPRRLVLLTPARRDGLQGAIVDALQGAQEASREALAAQLVQAGALRLARDGRPPSHYDRALSRLRADGVVGFGGIWPTEAGIAAVQGSPEAVAVLEGEQRLLEESRRRTATLRERCRQAEALMRQAQALLLAPLEVHVARGTVQAGREVRGLPGRTRWVPGRGVVQGDEAQDRESTFGGAG